MNKRSILATTLYTASVNKRKTVLLSNTKFTVATMNMLVNHGFLAGYKVKNNEKILAYLKYDERGSSAISAVVVLSQVGKKFYCGLNQLEKIKSSSVRGTPATSTALVILSTSKGLMSINQAIQNKIGGEMIFLVR